MTEREVEVDTEQFFAAGAPQQKKLRDYRDRLLADPFIGDQIPRDRIPRRFRHPPNLFWLELPRAWGCLYTVATHPGRVEVIRIVWIGDHTRYDRLFGFS